MGTKTLVGGGAALIHFQGVTTDNGTGNDLSAAELNARGIYASDLSGQTINNLV